MKLSLSSFYITIDGIYIYLTIYYYYSTGIIECIFSLIVSPIITKLAPIF